MNLLYSAIKLTNTKVSLLGLLVHVSIIQVYLLADIIGHTAYSVLRL